MNVDKRTAFLLDLCIHPPLPPFIQTSLHPSYFVARKCNHPLGVFAAVPAAIDAPPLAVPVLQDWDGSPLITASSRGHLGLRGV